MATRLTTELFIEKARKIHGDKFCYDKVEYTLSSKKVTIVCPKHGDFEQTPNNHLRNRGCHKCSSIYIGNTKKFINDAINIHGNKYKYSQVKYTKTRNKVIITCLEHGDFEQTPNTHLRGKGCPKCGHNNLTEDLFESYITEYFPTLKYFRDKTQPHLRDEFGIRRYDFFFPQLLLNIELDGRQHYEPINDWGGAEYLSDIQRNDKWKDMKSAEYGIDVIRVPYFDFKANMKKNVTRRYFMEMIVPILESRVNMINSNINLETV